MNVYAQTIRVLRRYRQYERDWAAQENAGKFETANSLSKAYPA
jgi:hypothetical protein